MILWLSLLRYAKHNPGAGARLLIVTILPQGCAGPEARVDAVMNRATPLQSLLRRRPT
jgi:hypothetical protein